MNSPKPPPQKFPIGYVNFGNPSLPIYRNLRYFTLDLRLKIKILYSPIAQGGLAVNGMPKRPARRRSAD
jgi:hypothetical protein